MTDSEEQLEALARQAVAAADRLHACIDDVQRLRDTLLAHIDEISGDREFNWALQADLGHALTAIHSASYKARTVARHARGVSA